MNEIDKILMTIKSLRDKDTGCPWDREQNIERLLKPLKEETEELREAIEEQDNTHIAEELGDVIWNALMLLEVAEEEGVASKAEILEAVNNKMIQRHPHVFSTENASSVEEAIEAYSKAKAIQQKS